MKRASIAVGMTAWALAWLLEAGASPVGSLTVGGRVDEDALTGYGEIVAPVWQSEGAMLFVSPRGSLTDSDNQEVNIGLGYRRLLSVKETPFLFGGNVYYDSRWTRADHQFDQIGVGVEFLSRWVDARANYYGILDDDQELVDTREEVSQTTSTKTEWGRIYPQGNSFKQESKVKTTTVTTRRVYNSYEAAAEGWDAEIGMLVPGLDRWVETRVFAGYQRFDNPFGGTLDGAKARLEVRGPAGLILDAEWFENEELNASDYSVGARLELPFDMARLTQGKNPFTGGERASAVRELGQRMSEPVIRDLKVRTTMSALIEDETQQSQTVTTQTRKKTVTLVDGVTFVDGDNDSGIENGTYEYPFNTIQEGVNAANSPVFVFDAGNIYSENVEVNGGVDLYGNGTVLVGRGGRRYGGGAYPVVQGMAYGNGRLPDIENGDPEIYATIRILGDDVTVAGLHVLEPEITEMEWDTGGRSPLRPEVALAGIYGRNVTDVRIFDNVIQGSGGGPAEPWEQKSARGPISLDGPMFDPYLRFGVLLESYDRPSFSARITDNMIFDWGYMGVLVEARGGYGPTALIMPPPVAGSMDVEVSGYLAGNGHGALITGQGFDQVRVDIHDLEVLGNGEMENGFHPVSLPNGAAALVCVLDGGDVDLSLRNLEVSHNESDGLFFQVNPYRSGNVTLQNVYVSANEGNGVQGGMHADMPGVLTRMDVDGLYASYNAGNGFNANVMGRAGAELNVRNSYAELNGYHGFGWFQVWSEYGDARLSFENCGATWNQEANFHWLGTIAENGNADLIMRNIYASDSQIDCGIGGSGIAGAWAWGVGHKARVLLDGVESRFNEKDGLGAMQAYGTGGADAEIEILNSVFSDNNGYGLNWVEARADGDSSGDASIRLVNVDASRNLMGNVGHLEALADSGNAFVRLKNVTANDSAMGGGLGDDSGTVIARASGIGHKAQIHMNGVEASGNHSGGSLSYALAKDGATVDVRVRDSRFNDNGFSGLDLRVNGPGSVLMGASEAIGNGSYGVVLRGSMPDGWINLGDQTVDIGGFNSFYGNQNADVAEHMSSAPLVKAENNWWGGNFDPTAAGRVSGYVDASPWLTQAP